MIYVVLGMHKSGTTLVSRILHESGIPMGEFDTRVGYDEGNKFERLETHDLNIELLGTDYEEFSLNVTRPLKNIAAVPSHQIEKMRKFLEGMSRHSSDWGFKDPRTCLTYSLWKTILPPHKLICIFREPAALWKHYQPKNLLRLFKALERSWKSLTAWYIHNQEMLGFIENSTDAYYLAQYGDFMQNEADFKRLCAFTGRPLKDCRDARLNRSRSQAPWFYRLSVWVQKVFFKRDIPALYAKLEVLASRQAR